MIGLRDLLLFHKENRLRSSVCGMWIRASLGGFACSNRLTAAWTAQSLHPLYDLTWSQHQSSCSWRRLASTAATKTSSGLSSSPTSDSSSSTFQMPSIKVLNVAEKNDAAKNLSAVMAGGHNQARRREGLSKFNKIYEFRTRVQGHDCDMAMTSVSGHLLGLDFEERYRKWNSCPPLDLFSLPVRKTCPERMLPIKVIIISIFKCQHFHKMKSNMLILFKPHMNELQFLAENFGTRGQVRQVAHYMDRLRQRGREHRNGG